MSPLFILFTINAALLPIPPLTESTAGVLADEPTNRPELKSEERIVLPLPAAVRVRLLLAVVLSVGLVPAKEIVLPLTVRLPPRVVSPVPVVIAAPFAVFNLRADKLSMIISPVVLPPMVNVLAF